MSIFGAIGSAIGGVFGASSQRKMFNAQLGFQKDYAKNRLQWTVEDAKRAGVHPLAALGASYAGPSAVPAPSSSVGDALGEGARAIGSALSSRKAAAMASENAALQNDLLRAQIDATKADTFAVMASAAESRSTAQRVRATPSMFEIETPAGKFTTSATTPQQDVEDQYGGIVGEAYGVGRFLNDTVKGAIKNRGGIWPGVLGY